MDFWDENNPVEFLPSADPGNIVIIENFIDKKHLSMLMDYCMTISEWHSGSGDNGSDSLSSYKHMKENAPELYGIMRDYMKDVKQKIEFKFGRNLEPAEPGIRRWVPGEYIDLHADGETAAGVPSFAYIVDYGSIIYINEDYDGGELSFPAYRIKFKPKAGTLVFFPSNNNYSHYVTEVESGLRFTSAHFWTPTKHLTLVEMAKNGTGEF
jgi:predicted 2-oxoglutarate/Fe(II)-dependent dioxygenase YbiX